MLDAVDRGMPREEVARIFGISLSSIIASPMPSRASTLGWLLLHAHPSHAGTVRHLHPQDVALQVHLVADLGGASKLSEDQAAYSVEVLALEVRAHNLVDPPMGIRPSTT